MCLIRTCTGELRRRYTAEGLKAATSFSDMSLHGVSDRIGDCFTKSFK